jgi:photosystem II stability/assembly factor-like uncharacterized protein
MKKLLPVLFLLLTISLNAQWVEQTSGVTAALRSVSVVTEDVAWVSGASGTILRTIDGGATWTSVGGTALGTATGHYIYAVDANTALVCANPSGFGQVWRTTDAGANWTKVFEQTGGFLNGLAMFSSTNGFFTGDPVGGRWTNFRTTDGGATWDSTGMFLAQAGAEAGWNNAIFTMGSKLWYGTDNSRAYYSTDAGATFTAQAMPMASSRTFYFTSPTRGITGGAGLNQTNDGGATWTDLTALGSGNVYAVVGYQNTWYYIRGAIIYKSVDDGANWTESHTGAGTIYHLTNARNGADVAFAVKAGGVIVKGTALGLPVELTSFEASVVNDKVVLNWSTATEINNRGFEVQRKSEGAEFVPVGFVNGNGTTTQNQNYTFTDQVSFGSYSYRLKQVDFNGAFEYSNEVEIDFNNLDYSLEQNYPNPFNPSTKILFVTKDHGFVNLKVYNILGNEVAVLMNEAVDGGVHEVTFDGTGLSSGVYFYTLTTDNYRETRKMLLMK